MDLSLHLTFSWFVFVFTGLAVIGLAIFPGIFYRVDFKFIIVGGAVGALTNFVRIFFLQQKDTNSLFKSIFQSSQNLYTVLIVLAQALVFCFITWLGVKFIKQGATLRFEQSIGVGSGLAAVYLFLNYARIYLVNIGLIVGYNRMIANKVTLTAEQAAQLKDDVVKAFSSSADLMLLDWAAAIYWTAILIAVTVLLCKGIESGDKKMIIGATLIYAVVTLILLFSVDTSAYLTLGLGVLFGVASLYVIMTQRHQRA